MKLFSQTPESLAAAWDRDHISSLFPSLVRQTELKKYLDQLRGLGVGPRGRPFLWRP